MRRERGGWVRASALVGVGGPRLGFLNTFLVPYILPVGFQTQAVFTVTVLRQVLCSVGRS